MAEVAEEGGTEQAGYVGVVHDVAAAVAVDFIGVDGAIDGVGDDAVGCYCCGKGGGEGGHFGCECCVVFAEGGHDLSGCVEVVCEHHVGWDEELVDA